MIAFDISSATTKVASGLLNPAPPTPTPSPLTILSDTTIRKPGVDQDLIPYCKSEKRPRF